MEKLVIDRAEWLTGTALKIYAGPNVEHTSGCLRDSKSGQKCCLGFYGEKLELPRERLQYHGSLLTLLNWLPTCEQGPFAPTLAWLRGKLDALDQKRWPQVNVEDALVHANDGRLHPKRREAAIAYLFKKYGDIEVEFVGSYAEGTRRAKWAHSAR